VDALALVEAGIPVEQVISVPTGAPKQAAKDPLQTDRYKYVIAGLEEGLSRVKKFVIAVDSDAPGRALRLDLVRLLGAARCYFVEWPADIKDADDFLMKHGPDDLRMFIQEDEREWPVEGLYLMSDLPEPDPMELWTTGFAEWSGKIWLGTSCLSVVTGWPNHGKTTFMAQLWYQVARNYNLSVAMASFETGAKPYHRRNIRQFMFGKPEKELSNAELLEADTYIDSRFLWLVHPDDNPTLEWILDKAEVAAVRHGVRVLQIDPWNHIDASKRNVNESETDWISRSLLALRTFAKQMRIHVQIIAHPAKGHPLQRNAVPRLTDIHGSAHWNNHPDHGFAIHRDAFFADGKIQNDAKLYVLKSRYGDQLGYPMTLDVEYNFAERRYRALPIR
jgi:twinkle protein